MPDEKYVNLKPLGSPSAVGEYPKGASPFGLMDMVGNVWQWVQDFYGETFYGNSPISNPGGPGGGLFRVIRGGSWFNNGSQFLCVYNRGWLEPSKRHKDTGFRVVLPAK
jgi:serine/threonine-protein kinase